MADLVVGWVAAMLLGGYWLLERWWQWRVLRRAALRILPVGPMTTRPPTTLTLGPFTATEPGTGAAGPRSRPGDTG